MSSELCVLEAPAAGDADGVERPGAGPHAGFGALTQSILTLSPGAVARRSTGEAEEAIFVLHGGGALRLSGAEHELEPESGAHLAPGEEYEICAGPAGIGLLAVRIPDPVPSEPASEPGPAVRRLGEQRAQAATTDREFRIVGDPSCGLYSATHFVGYIPTVRAPEHFHTYDEVIYVLEGEGRFHARDASWPVAAGTCIGLPSRVVHCLENTGPGIMRVVGVFRPAGSPAAAYYPDGTPATVAASPA